MQGLSCADGDVASAISAACFDLGMVIETSGSEGQVVKCLVPLTISEEELATGLGILGQAVNRVVGKPALKKAS
jgi:diaminobutyrate-2-oxoglutarate transaminase